MVQAVNEVYDSSKGVVDLYAKNIAAGAGANGWTDLIIEAQGGLNQRQINNGLNSIAELLAIQNPSNSQSLTVKGYHKPTVYAELNPYKGGGRFTFNASMSKAKHDGGTIIDPDKVYPSDWKNRTQVNEWFLPSNTGTGCWVREYEGSVNVLWFGVMPNFSLGIDNSIGINRALLTTNNITLPHGNYIIHRPILTSKANAVIKGDGVDTTLITVENAYWQGTTYNGKSYNACIVDTSGQDNIWIEAATIQDLTLIGNSYSKDGK